MLKEKIRACVSPLIWERKTSGIIALGLLMLALIVLAITRPEATAFQQLFATMCVGARGPVTIFCYLCLAVLVFLTCSRYGNIRLGGEKSKPEYSMFSWLSCLFMAGCGIGIVYYCQEPVLHLHNNPYLGHVWGDAEGVAYSLSLFEWTINDWSQFALLGVILAYFHYNCGKDLRMSSVLPAQTPLWVRRAIDITMALGVIAGLTTSLGLGAVQLSEGMAHVFDTMISPYALMFFMAVVALWSVISGLHKGIKWLSNLTTILVGTLLVSVLCIGVFGHGIHDFVSYIGKGTGLLLANFIRYNDFYNATTTPWVAEKFIFNNLWFAAWAAFVAVFVAKISKGRTIRQFILGVVAVPTAFTIVWFGIFGRMGMEYSDMISQSMTSNISTALFVFLQSITANGYYVLLSALVLMVICMFFITSSDSGSYVVATLLSREKHVSAGDKVLWATIQCVVAMVLYWCGDLILVQSVSVIMGIVVMALMCIGTYFFFKKLIQKENSK